MSEYVSTSLGEYHIGELRHVASQWHSGQWSALYAFSSSGTPTHGLGREAEQCAAQCHDTEESDKLRAIATLQPAESDE